MNEVTAWPIRAETNAMESAAQLRFILWVTRKTANLVRSMSKLAFVTIFTCAVLLVLTAQFSLVARGVGLGTAPSLQLHRLLLLAAAMIPAVVTEGSLSEFVLFVHQSCGSCHCRHLLEIVAEDTAT